MGRRSNRLRRWASLSALASAALAASSGSGEAAIIYHSAHGIGPDATLPLPNNTISVFNRGSGGFSDNTNRSRPYFGAKGRLKTFLFVELDLFGFFYNVSARGVSFRRSGRSIALAKKGQTFNQVGSGAGSGQLASCVYSERNRFGFVSYRYGPRAHRFPQKIYGYSNHSSKSVRQKLRVRVLDRTAGGLSYYQSVRRTAYDLAGLGKQFALFRFDVGSQTDYGWLELSLGNHGRSAPFVRLIGYAYETTGEPIRAGAVPEPEHLPLALGALALGAMGVREWRRKRNAAA